MPRIVAERADTLPALAEVFRERGFEGASLSLISNATGLGKGSLYHFFPGGKEEMMSAVLVEIDSWFEDKVFAPLRSTDEPQAAITAMFDAVSAYFRSGQRVCLVGALALGDTRDRFAESVCAYFTRWVEVLGDALARSGQPRETAVALAEEVVMGIQGAIVLARALSRKDVFERAIERLRRKLESGAQPKDTLARSGSQSASSDLLVEQPGRVARGGIPKAHAADATTRSQRSRAPK